MLLFLKVTKTSYISKCSLIRYQWMSTSFEKVFNRKVQTTFKIKLTKIRPITDDIKLLTAALYITYSFVWFELGCKNK